MRRCALIIVSVLFLFLTPSGFAATIAADSCSLADVQAAVTAAARGDTVTVPAGSCSWASELSIDKSITLQGAGAGTTVITSTQAVTGSCISDTACKFMIRYTPSSIAADASVLMRITGFTLDADFRVGHILINNDDATTPHTMVRIDNNALTDGNYAVATSGSDIRAFAMIRGPVYGVMDNNTITGAPTLRIYGTGEWEWENLPWSAGTANTFFVEDNSFVYDYPSHTDWSRTLDSTGSGASWVVRYNDYTASPASSAAIMLWDSHPSVDGMGTHATRGKEAYGNDLTGMGRFNPRCNGGQSIVFYNRDNDTSSTYVPSLISQMDYDNEPDLSTCGTNAVPSEVGRNSCAAAVSGYTMPQHPHREFEWANWYGSSPTKWPGYVSSGRISLRANVDYFNYNTSFGTRASGNSTGVGCGTLAARPATCTTGVAYWATNQSCSSIANYVGRAPTTPISGTLYRCSTTDTWSAYYTPYTYPHPLRGVADTTDPIISNVCAGAGSCVTPIIEIACAEEDETIDVIIGASTNENATVKYDSSAGTDYTTGTWDGTMTGGGGTAHTATLPGLACGASYTRYLKASDTSGNITDADTTLTFTIASRAGATPTVTNITGQYQAIAPLQSIDVTTDVAATCRLCVKDVSGCSSSTSWADRTQFTATGGDTVHHSAQIAVTESSTNYIEVLCQDTQGNQSANVEVTVTTDAKKTVTASGDQRVSVTGTKPVTVLP